MRNIKDYLHLYLGCEFEYLSGSKTYIDIIKSVGTTVNLSYAPQDVKLILRPLSDMTEDEVIELCKAYSPEAFGDYRFSKWVATRDEKNFCYNVTNGSSDMSFDVGLEKMHIKVYERGHDTYPGIENHTYFLEYLKMGFDIFGLIEAGLAIDKTTLK